MVHSVTKRWGKAGSIPEVLDRKMWLTASATKCWGKAGSIPEVLDCKIWLTVSAALVGVKRVSFQRS